MHPKRKAPLSTDSDEDGPNNGDTGEPPPKRNKFDNMTNEAALNSQLGAWSSSVYDHFIKPPTIFTESKDGKDVVMYKFICGRNPSKHVARRRDDPSTSNLVKHVRTCLPGTASELDRIEAYAHGRSYTPEALRLLLVKWVTSCSRPYAIVEDQPFLQIVKMLYNKAVLVSAHTLSTDVRKVFHLAKESVVKTLSEHKGQIHISCDGWTSPNIVSFLGVLAHWTSNGKMTHIILDFVRLDRGHTGQYLAGKLLECFKEYKIEKKVLGIACDNASNNSTMLEALSQQEPSFIGKEAQVRCLCHILNLIVKAILSQFYSATITPTTIITRKRTNTHPNDYDEAEYDSEGEDEADLENITNDMADDKGDNVNEPLDDLEMEQDAFDKTIINEINAQITNDIYTSAAEKNVIQFHLTSKHILRGRLSITKLVALSKKIFNNPTLRSDLAAACVQCNTKEKVLIRPVATRWNSLLPVIARAVELRAPLKLLCELLRHNGRGSYTPLSKFYLSDSEWDLLVQLMPLLKIFEMTSISLQKSDTPAVSKTLMLFDFLTTHLETFTEDASLAPAIRAAAKRGLTMVDKYTKLTSATLLPRLAIILHPWHKLHWFRDNGWSRSAVDDAAEALQDMWMSRYKTPKNAPETTAKPAATQQGAKDFDFNTLPSFEDHCRQNLKIPNDELAAYLDAPPDLTVEDPIKYWAGHSGDLARMGLDICGCPGTSTDVERAFSGGRLTVSRMRHSLSSESTRAATVLGSWVKIPGLLPEHQLLHALRGRGKDSSDTAIIDLDD